MVTKVGTIVHGREIGREDGSARRKFVWAQCPSCEDERWVRHDGGPFQSAKRYCKDCVIFAHKDFKYGAQAISA